MSIRDIDKLPIWAQLRIQRLENQLAEALKHIETLSSRGGKAPTRVRVTHGDNPDRMLSEHCCVDFWLGNPEGGKYHDGQVVSARLRGSYVEVSSLTGALRITPESSNMVRVRLGEF